ncbi:hypothetical protein RhiirC2_198360 [Rhizophagus irregularis]|uniref:Uncharacterized protein n=1 Tax=Rhizophagus irregularis TaxID=588596 RepID=A0A2N1MJQ1_9GLOM|nr:hypothetical protein RhiirC2_198360 [Rhizophagus irregularis]
MCLSGRSPCEKAYIKHVGVCRSSANFLQNIPVKCRKIRDLTVSELEAKIKTDRTDLEEINIELYRKDFLQENIALINTVNSDKPEKRQGVWMDPQKKISQCFSLGEEDFPSPFPLEEGKIAVLKPINIIIYPQVERNTIFLSEPIITIKT